MTLPVPAILAGLMIAGSMLVPLAARASSPPDPQSAGRTVAAIPLDEAVTNGGLVMQAHAETLRPAPLPNRDFSLPTLSRDAIAAQTDPSLVPGFINPNSHFAGDGYAAGSSIEGDHNHRHSTGGLMSLSIPMP